MTVIVPSFTFYATIGAIACTGAKPVFVDINYDLNIDPKEIEKITKRLVILWFTGVGEYVKCLKLIELVKNIIYQLLRTCHAILAKYKINLLKFWFIWMF